MTSSPTSSYQSGSEICSSESSDSVASVIHVSDTTAAATAGQQNSQDCRTVGIFPALSVNNNALGRAVRPTVNVLTAKTVNLSSSLSNTTAISAIRRQRPESLTSRDHQSAVLVIGNHSNGCYVDDDSSESSTDDEIAGGLGDDVEAAARRHHQLRHQDDDTSSSSSESSQIWVPAMTSKSSTARLTSTSTTTLPNFTSFRTTTTSHEHSHFDAASNQTHSTHSNGGGQISSDIDVADTSSSSPADSENSHGAHGNLHAVAPLDSGLGNEVSPESDFSDRDQLSGHSPSRPADVANAVDDDITTRSSQTLPATAASGSFFSSPGSLMRSASSSVQPLEPVDCYMDPGDCQLGDTMAIYSTPSASRASSSRRKNDQFNGRQLEQPYRRRRYSSSTYTSHQPSDGLSNLSAILSSLYAMLVVVIGASLSVAELSPGYTASLQTFQWYYIYLFLTSIVFLAFAQVVVTRCQTGNMSPRTFGRHESDVTAEVELNNQTLQGLLPTNTATSPVASMSPPVVCYRSTKHDNKYSGTFYLRLGAVGFAIGAMVSESLHFAHFVELNQGVMSCLSPVEIVRSLLHILFTFMQLYFIFMRSETRFQVYQSICRFGLMHLIATNLAVWLRVIVVEILSNDTSTSAAHLSSIHRSNVTSRGVGNIAGDALAPPFYHHLVTTTTTIADLQQPKPIVLSGFGLHVKNTSAENNEKLCGVPVGTDSSILSTITGYLYPFICQYAFIATALNCLIWYNVGKSAAQLSTDVYSSDFARKTEPSYRRSNSGTSHGLFLGLIVLVGTVVMVTVCLVLLPKQPTPAVVVDIADMIQLVLCSVTTVAVLILAFSLRHVWRNGPLSGTSAASLNECRFTSLPLNEILLVLSLGGLVAVGVFGTVASRNGNRVLALAGNVSMITHAVAQVLVVLTGLRRCVTTGSSCRVQLLLATRQLVTFLAVCNVALLVSDVNVSLVVGDSNRKLVDYRSAVASLLCVPLASFHRLQSTACLAIVWKLLCRPSYV